jgi:hypothetical protein
MTTATETTGRRSSLRTAALGAAALSVAALPRGAPAQQATAPRGGSAPTDADILAFALNLEYLETEYYLMAARGAGLGPAELGGAAGPVRGGRKLAFSNPAFQRFAEELALNEAAHVRYLRGALGRGAVQRPPIDFEAGFAGVAQAAGLGPGFDPFGSEEAFFLGSMLFEDTGVTAYKGAAPLLRDKEILKAAAGITAVEAYHMGMTRSVLYRMGGRARAAAQAISDLRDRLDGPADLDQGVVLNGRANTVPSDGNGVAFSRTPQQVLRIVYGTDRSGVAGGGFFPSGFGGALRVT